MKEIRILENKIQEMSIDIKAIQEIYNKMQDAESKSIFVERLLFSVTDNYIHILNIINKIPELEDFCHAIKNEKVYLFGAGVRGESILTCYGSSILAIIDNDKNKWGKICYGRQVIGPDVLLQTDNKIVICPKYHYEEILMQLDRMGINNNRIINLSERWNKLNSDQYFSLPDMPIYEKEVFVDAGCYDGYSTEKFMEWAGKSEKTAYCFEPDMKNIELLKHNDKLKKNVKIFEMGLWSKHEIISFSSDGTQGAKIDEAGEASIEVEALDEVIPENESVSFIKMDIEGAEFDALLGAERIIRRHKPKLAISIYHKPEDIVEIPNLLLDLNPEYKLYIRHYSATYVDTILYAV